MERTEVLDMIGALKLHGMKGAYDETLATALKRKPAPQQRVGDPLKAENLGEAGPSIKPGRRRLSCPAMSSVGDTRTGKTHLAIAIARSCIGAGSRGPFFNTVGLVNRLEAEARASRQGRPESH